MTICPMLLANSRTSSVTSGAVPGWGMTSTTLEVRTSWKCRAANFSGLPVLSAIMEGTSIDVLVVKIVLSGQSSLNWLNTRALTAGSSGTDSLMKSASRAASTGSEVPEMRAMISPSCSGAIRPVETNHDPSFCMRLMDLSRISWEISYMTTVYPCIAQVNPICWPIVPAPRMRTRLMSESFMSFPPSIVCMHPPSAVIRAYASAPPSTTNDAPVVKGAASETR